MQSLETVLCNLKKGIESLPDEYLFTGQIHPPPVLNKSIDDLLSISEPAPFGRGTETLVDLSVRKTYQILPHEFPDLGSWDGLNSILESVGNSINRVLKARLDKVLVYNEGDFFQSHRDSKKTPNHLMTLSVICAESAATDAQVVFRDQAWEGCMPGSFGCWFCSEEHHVNNVTGGHRVVLSYIVEVTDFRSVDILTPITNLTPCNFSLLPDSVVDYIVSWLGFTDQWSFSRSCNPMYRRYGKAEALFHGFLREHRNFFLSIDQVKHKKTLKSVGFFMLHMYSNDGKDYIDELHIRGRDSIVCNAFKTAFHGLMIEKKTAFLRKEFLHEDSDSESSLDSDNESIFTSDDFVYFKPIQAVTSQFPNNISRNQNLPVPQKLRRLLPEGISAINRNLIDILQDTEYEWDDYYNSQYFWPFFQTLFVFSKNDVSRIERQEKAGSNEQCWGNSCTFNIYWYKTAVMIFHFVKNKFVEDAADVTIDLDKDIGANLYIKNYLPSTSNANSNK